MGDECGLNPLILSIGTKIKKKNIIQLWDTIATPKEWLKTWGNLKNVGTTSSFHILQTHVQLFLSLGELRVDVGLVLEPNKTRI